MATPFPAVTVCSAKPDKLSSMQRLSVSNIQLGSSFNYKYIEGRITTLWPLQSSVKIKRMKMILTENETAAGDVSSANRIIVFLYGAFAEEFVQFSEGDTVLISEALIEQSPTFNNDAIHPCLIIVENAKSRPSIWVLPAKKRSKTSTTGTKHTSTSTVTRPMSISRLNLATVQGSDTVTQVQNRSTRQNVGGKTKEKDQGARPSDQGARPSDQEAGPSDQEAGPSDQGARPSDQGARPSDQEAGPSDQEAGPSDQGARPSDQGARPSDQEARLSDQGARPSDQGAGPSDQAAGPSDNSNSDHPMSAWTVSSTSTSPAKRHYTYTLLKDLTEASKVNLYGVVKFFKPAYKTKGPDYAMTVTLIDPTLDENHRGLRCQLFENSIQSMPQIRAIGDIVRFHRLKITCYGSDFQGKKGFGFQSLTFDGGIGSSLEPRSSSATYTMTNDDKQKVKELRSWSRRQTQLTMQDRDCVMSKMYAGQYLDLTCQVVSVATVPTESCTVIRVWDGTHYRGRVRVMDIEQAISTKCDAELAMKSEGLAFDVTLYNDHMETGSNLEPGQFIKICNLHVAKFRQAGASDGSRDMVELVLHHGTSYGRGVVILNKWEQRVKDTIKRMEEVEEDAQRESSHNSAQPLPVTSAAAEGSMAGGAGTPSSSRADAAGVPSTSVVGGAWTPSTSTTGAAGVPSTSTTGAAGVPSTSTTGAAGVPSTSTTGAAGVPSTSTTGAAGVLSTSTTGAAGVPSTSTTGAAGVPSTSTTGAAGVPSTSTTGAAGVPSTSTTGAAGVLSTSTTGAAGVPSTSTTGAAGVPSTSTTGAAGVPSTSTTGAAGVPSTSTTGAAGVPSTSTTGAAGVPSTSTTGVSVTGSSYGSSSLQGTSRCMQRSVSVINDHFHQRIVPIEEVIRCREPNMFRIRARVSDYQPHDVRDFIRLYCSECNFRCRVPPPVCVASKTTEPPKKADSASTRTSPTKSSRIVIAGAVDMNDEQVQGTSARVRTRSKTGVQRRTHRQQNKRDPRTSTATEKDLPRREGTVGKHKASWTSSEEEGAASPRKSRRIASKLSSDTSDDTSSPAKRTLKEKNASPRGTSKRSEEFDVSGCKVKVVMQRSGVNGQQEGRCETTRPKYNIEVENPSVGDTLLMVKSAIKPASLIGMVSIASSTEQSTRNTNSKMYYICPKCLPTYNGQPHTPKDALPLMQYTYGLKLVLDDGTGSIEVIMNKQHGQTFFSRIRATNLHTDQDAKAQLEEVMAEICPLPAGQKSNGSSQSVSDQSTWPSLECCIMSYPVQLGGKEVIKYQMFDTTLALDVE